MSNSHLECTCEGLEPTTGCKLGHEARQELWLLQINKNQAWQVAKDQNCIQVQGSGAQGLLLAHGLQSCTVQGELERTEENTQSKD